MGGAAGEPPGEREEGHSHRLHDKHPHRGEQRRLLEHLRIVRRRRALLGGQLVVAAQVRHVVLVALDGVDGLLRTRNRKRGIA